MSSLNKWYLNKPEQNRGCVRVAEAQDNQRGEEFS